MEEEKTHKVDIEVPFVKAILDSDKTFEIRQNDPRKLLLLQKMFGHSSAAQTLDYIGITGEEIEKAYMELNLGSKKHYLIDSTIGECEVKQPTA